MISDGISTLKCNAPIKKGHWCTIDVLCKLTTTSYMVWILTVKEPKKMQSRKFKGALSGLAKVLAAESPLKMITFYFTSKALFLHKILNLFLGLLVM